MKITPIFVWYDFWVGFYWDRKESILYFFPVPMFGFKIETEPPKKRGIDETMKIVG